MTDVDASQVGGTVGASQPSGVVGASQVGGTVGARLAKPQANLWTPAQLGSDLALWLDWQDSPFDLRTDGGMDYVERWGDLSGNGNDATQSTGSQQPIKSSSSINFQGGQWLDTVSSAKWTSAIALFKYSTQNGVIVGSLIARNTYQMGALQRNWYIFDDRKRNTYYTKPPNTDYHVGGGNWRKNQLWLDGQKQPMTENNNAGTNTYPIESIIRVGGRKNSGNEAPFVGELLALVCMNEQTEGVRKKIQGFLAHKAARNGIPEPLQNLPADHPYSDSPPTV